MPAAKPRNEHFATVYVTLVSIIQAVALEALAKNVYHFTKDHGFWDQHVFLLRALLCLGFIVLITFEYLIIYVGYGRVETDIRDILIPFGIGAAEYFPIYTLDNDFWFWSSILVLCICGMAGFFNTYIHLHRIDPRKGEPRDEVHLEHKTKNSRNIAFIAMMGIIVAVYPIERKIEQPNYNVQLELFLFLFAFGYLSWTLYANNKFWKYFRSQHV